MDIPYHSEEAKVINKNIFETIYHGALEQSMEISRSRSSYMSEIRNTLNGRESNFIEELSALLKKHIDMNEDANLVETDECMRAFRELNIIQEELEGERSTCSEELLGSYSSFIGSPASNGELQFDMWGVKPSDRYDWNAMKENIKQFGLRNSLLVAPMPTASTSQILGNNECFEPITSNIYTRRTLAGEFVVVNKYLMKELIELGVWNEELEE